MDVAMNAPHPQAQASPGPVLAKTFAQAAVFWSLFLGVFPWLIHRAEPAFGLDRLRLDSFVLSMAGVLLFAAASALGIASAVFMSLYGRGTPLPLDPAVRLVVAGPYAYVRNPMAVAGLAQGLGVAMWLGSPGTVIYVVCGMLMWDFVVRPWEEADLVRRFGGAYEQYRANVRCWIPRRSAYRVSSAPTHTAPL